MFGVDSGYVDLEHHHSKDSMYYDEKGETVYQPMKIGKQMQVPGNFAKQVYTDHFLHTGKLQMEKLLTSVKGTGLECFNCSDGVKIEGTFPLPSENIILPATRFDKKQVVDFIQHELFSQKTEKLPLESYLNHSQFSEICKVMVEILGDEALSRGEELGKLLTQVRFLFSFKTTQYSHLYFLLEGEALYNTSILINMLFNFGTEEEILPYYQQAKALWCDFLTKAPEYYQQRWHELSNHDFIFN